MGILKSIGKWLLIILVILNLAIIISGRTYIYKGLANTYFKGRSGPSISEYEIFDNREVKAGAEQKWEISKFYNSKKIPADLVSHFEEMQTGAFVVIKDDSMIHEQYWDGLGPDTRSNSFSMAKSFVGMLTGVALKEGKIKSLDQPVSDFLPEYKEGDNAQLTIRHLLTMSSGINFDENYVSPFAYPAQAYYGSDLHELTYGYKVTEEGGKIFKYLSGNTELLGFILQKATGKTLSEYMSEKIWKPVGAKNDALWSLDAKDGMEKAYCCFNSNAPDFARLGQLYLDSGKWNGQEIIPAQYVAEAVVPAPLNDVEGKKVDNYGYHWWIVPDYNGHYIFYARGILGQYIACIPDQHMVVVRLGSKREKKVLGNHPIDLDYYLDAALQMYGNK
jgi:CubicO group peptidase (beta-lactamase class C family)